MEHLYTVRLIVTREAIRTEWSMFISGHCTLPDRDRERAACDPTVSATLFTSVEQLVQLRDEALL